MKDSLTIALARAATPVASAPDPREAALAGAAAGMQLWRRRILGTKTVLLLYVMPSSPFARMVRTVIMAQITPVCARHLERRNPDIRWRPGQPKLAQWIDEIGRRPSIAATAPPANPS